MTLQDRLRRIVEPLPPGAAVTLPADVLREWLDGEPGTGGQAGDGVSQEPLVDLTVEDVAKLVGRAPSTVRWWCQKGTLPGAYRLRNREWRVPRAALRALRSGSNEPPRLASRHAPLDAYKREAR